MHIKKYFSLFLLFFISTYSFALSSYDVITMLHQNAQHQSKKQYHLANNLLNWDLWSKPPTGKSYLKIEYLKNNNQVLFSYVQDAYLQNIIYRSQDSGKSWKQLNKFNGYITDLSNINDTLFLLSNNSFYISQDQGEHWNLSNKGIKGMYFTKIFPVNSKLIYLGYLPDQSYFGYLYRSTDGGASWSPIMLGLNPTHGIKAFAAKDNLAVAIQNTRDYSTSELYVSTNYGNLWKKIFTINTSVYNPTIVINQKNIIFVKESENIFITDIAGKKWEKMDVSILNKNYIETIKLDNKDRLYVATQNNLYRYTENDKHWELLAEAERIIDFDLLDNGKIYLSTNKGLSISDANQKNYTSLFSDNYIYIEKLFVKNNIAYYWDNKFLYCSIDAGKQWKLSYQTSDWYPYPILNFNNKFLMLENENIFMRDNENSTWKKIYSFTNFSPNLYQKENTIYAYGRKGVYASSDLSHWQNISTHYTRAIYKTGSEIYTADDSSIIKTSDNGKTWETILNIPVGDPNSMDSSYEINILTGYGNTILVALNGAGIIKTIDGGKNWEMINAGIENWNFNSLIMIDESFYITATNQGVYLTKDGGLTWHSTSDFLHQYPVNRLVVDDNNLYAAVNHLGIYKTQIK